MDPLFYDKVACMASPLEDGFRHFCPSDPAMLATELAMLAFIVLVAGYIVEGMTKDWREHKRRQRFERVYGHRQEGDADGQQGVGTPPAPWL